MDMDASSPPTSRRSSGSRPSLLVRLKLPPQALRTATANSSPSNINDHVSSLPPASVIDTKPIAALSPFPPSSPPTMASSPAPGAMPVKRRGGPQRKIQGLNPGAGVFSIAKDGTGSGAGTHVPSGTATGERERQKPGPKANPGGINAGLRALDRSGKRTRRWQKVKYPVHTCSGYVFHTTTWISPGMDPKKTETGDCSDEVVPGDGLYEKAMKKEAEEGFLTEGAKVGPAEQDTAMADVTPAIA